MIAKGSDQSAPETIGPRVYRPDIDGMRAVAVMLVLVFHFSLLTAVNAGFLGVDVFFVISGFLITSILLEQLEAGRFSFGSFYLSRIRRLAPSLLVVLLLVMFMGSCLLFPSEFIELSKQVLASQLYAANIYYWRTINYFGLGVHQVFLLHTWSLAVEEQFYLIYPACILVLRRYFGRHFWLLISIGFLVSFFLNIIFVVDKPEATFYLLPTRAWELFAGALVLPLAAKCARGRIANEMIGLLGAVLIIIGVTCYRSEYHFPGFYALLPTLGAGCLLLSGRFGNTTIARLLSCKPVVHLGKISYSLYLIHWPVNDFASQLIDDYSMKWRILMFALSIVLAEIMYWAVETPVRSGRILATRKALLCSYAGGLATTVLVVSIVSISRGLPERYPAEAVRLASFVNDRSDPLIDCESVPQSIESAKTSCRLGISGKKATWLIYGDSHAWAAQAAFDKWLELNGQSGLLMFRHACPPVNGIHFIFDTKDRCLLFNQSVTRFIESNSDITDIVLVSTWKWPTEGLLNAAGTPLPERDSLQLFTDSFLRTTEHLYGVGRRVYVWEPVPGGRKSVPLALADAALEHRHANIEFDLTEYISDNRLFFDALAKSHSWIQGSFSPAHTLCSTGKCVVESDGTPLYFDNAHVTKSSVDVWVKVLQSRTIDQ
jgi:peptidoglycan/LPS O-acetylase OafA/YrhL